MCQLYNIRQEQVEQQHLGFNHNQQLVVSSDAHTYCYRTIIRPSANELMVSARLRSSTTGGSITC